MQAQRPVSPERTAEKPTRPHRRNRAALSCEPCRLRKLKCNRQHPCQNCTARDEQPSCKFRGHGKDGAGAANEVPAAGGGLRQRIDNLETLVKKLIKERQPVSTYAEVTVYTPESPTPEPDSAVSTQDVPGVGKTVLDGGHSVYLSGNEWHVVLEEIKDLKKAWTQEEDESQSDHSITPALSYTVDGSSLLFNQVKPMERMEILSALPLRPEVDQLLSYFFSPAFPIHLPPILHEPTFMREYNEHWENPSRTSFMWLGLLFSILGITMLAYQQHGEAQRYKGISEPLFQVYRVRTSQCLLNGDIAKCLPYTVETLRFNATAELNRKDDNRRGLWIMSAVVVRAAINMGYHRDPSRIPGLSALQAEYRRRLWFSVKSMDDMASFLGGFPRMTAAVASDTAEPRNLHDWELSVDTAPAPPSRPLTEPTAATYLIVKGRLFRALGRVADFNSAPTLGSCEALRSVDTALRDARRGLDHMAAGAADMSYFGMLGMYHSGVCTLHRRFMALAARGDASFAFARERCVASALALLEMQQTLEPKFHAYWQTRQMMTLGAMVLFLELELRRKASPSDADAGASPDSSVLLQALEQSCDRWAQAVAACEEAGGVYRLLVSMMAGFHVAAPLETRFELSSPGLGGSNGFFSLETDFSGVDFDLVCHSALGMSRSLS
ncbi:uncharacterized protein C8A04DRAFT_39103 [Dichotomopilus funicola]|uniref:Zn(2)-C6 fungal-type domain-containing protein n=1 Tax=Dichotomopilus funicola TaxID=1934379 RepID=A0AAN6UZT4_9PEZI|nr:hypothetical protein C8A04DRAFT_39103 [Dichotomopilus funicola]